MIILDISLHDDSGFDIHKKIREKGSSHRLKAVGGAFDKQKYFIYEKITPF